MEIKRVLWLEDQYEDFAPYLITLSRAGYLVDTVRSVSEAEQKLREEDYIAAIFDIKVLPGDDENWIDLDEKKRQENPNFDSYLGLELLYSLFNPQQASVKLDPPIKINPKKVIVFSVVYDKVDEITSLGIPKEQIIYKSVGDITTLPRLIRNIHNERED
jgi:hypothetical protein